MDTLTRSKSMAKALKKALEGRHIALSHSDCLEVVARQLGFIDWNVLKAKCDAEMLLTVRIFVEHGRQQEASEFYQQALKAVLVKNHLHDGELLSCDLKFGDRSISVSGANPKRESEPHRGGPFFLKTKGSGSAVFQLDVLNAEPVLLRAVAAGAVIRDRLQLADNGCRAATFFDPFGNIWALHESAAATKRHAA